MRKSSNLIILFVLSVIVLYAFGGVIHTFFQQDEWQTMGHNLVRGLGGALYDWESGQNLIRVFFAQGRMFSGFMYFVLYSVRQFSVVPLFVFALLVHITNSWLVYVIASRVSRSFWIGIVAALFFAVNNVGNEAILWAAAVGTLPAAMLVLISLFWYLDFLETGSRQKRNISFIAGIASLYFKETGLFLFFFYPMLFILWGKGKSIIDVLKSHASLLLYGAGLLVFRVLDLLSMPKAAAGFVGNQTGNFWFTIVYQSMVYPLTSLSQVFMVPRDFYAFMPIVVRAEYPYLLGTPLFDLAGQSAVADAVSLVGTIFILAILTGMILFLKKKEQSMRVVWLGLLFFFLSFLPYVVLHRFFSYFSSRYYYVGIVGASFLFAYAVVWIGRRLSFTLKGILIILIGFFFMYHIQADRKDVQTQIAIATDRKAFLSEIKRVHPKLQDKTVFYITSDKKYYGDITYPFQNGLGFVLEVWYYDSGTIPDVFLKENFLWNLGEEGYKISGDRGFGYFEHLDKLAPLVVQGTVNPGIVYGYRYNSDNHIMMDITTDVRAQLATLSGQLQ